MKGFEIICFIGLHVTAVCRSGFRMQEIVLGPPLLWFYMTCFHCYISFADQGTSLTSCGEVGRGTPWKVLFSLKEMPSECGSPLLWSFRCSGFKFLLLLEWSSNVHAKTSGALRTMLGDTWNYFPKDVVLAPSEPENGWTSNPFSFSISFLICKVWGSDKFGFTIFFCLNML